MHNTLYTFATDGSGKEREKAENTGSVGTRRRFVGALVTVAVAAVMVLAGCEAAAPDITIPTVSDPSFTTTATGATVSIAVNEIGTLFWVAYADGTTAPADAKALIADAGKAKTAPIIANSGSDGQAVTAIGTQMVSVSGLAGGIEYDIYLVAQDAAKNISSISTKIDITTAPDIVPPTVSDASVTTTTMTGATVSITVNEIGKLFWVAYANDTTAPANPAALIADAGKAKAAPIIANSGSDGQTITATGAQSISVSGLAGGIAYDIYLVAQDAANNTSSISAKIDITTANDTVAPTVSDGSVGIVTDTTAVISITVNEIGKIFWVAYADGTTAPANAAALIADAGKSASSSIIAVSGSAGQAVTTAGVQSVSVGSLVTTTNYDFYAVAQDAANNTSSISTKIDILTSTVDTTVPTISGGSVSATTDMTATVSITVNEIGRIFWVAYADGTTAPTDAAALIADAGKSASSSIIAVSGSAGQAANTVGIQSVSVGSLIHSTNYDFYAVIQDPSSNTSNISTKVDITTTADTTAPTISGGSVDATTDTTATVSITVNETGTLFWVAYANNTARPTDAAALIADAAMSAGGSIIATSGSAGQTVNAVGVQGISVTNLVGGTNYDLYAVAQDSANNASALSAQIDISTPLAGTVTVGTVAETSSQVSIPVTNPNTVAVNVRIGISPAVAAATYTINGSAVNNITTTGFALAAGATQTLVIGGFTAANNYVISLTTVGSNGVAHSDIVTHSFALNVPTINGQSVGAITETTATVSITVSETGKLFWVVYTDGTAPTDAAALIADAGKSASSSIIAVSGSAGQPVTAIGVQSVPVTNLVAETDYDFYAVAQDIANNNSLISTKLDITSADDTTAPTISGGSVSATTDTTATVSITVNEIGKLFWVAYADGTTAPADAAALIADAGMSAGGSIIAVSGSDGQAITATGAQSISVTNLVGGTNYDLYAVAQDGASTSNTSALSALIDISTPPLGIVTVGTTTIASGQISVPVTNPNTGAVRVRVAISPAATGATYTVSASAVSNIATTGFALAASATQTLVIGSLTNGTTYMISLTTVSSNGAAHADIVNRSVTLSAPTAFTVTAASGAVVVSGSLRTTATLIWTNPSNAASVALAVSPTTGVTVPAVTTTAGAENSVTVSGLTLATAYTFTVTATNTIGNTPATATLTPSLPVVLWEASSGHDGNLGGFTYCQTELSGGATDTSGVHKTLYDAGYRTAKFFGSTPNYDFNDIATDTDALGAVGTRPLVTAAGSSFTAREISSGVAMTLADFTKSANRNTDGDITNSAIRQTFDSIATRLASIGTSWAFSTRSGIYHSDNCSGATSASGNGRLVASIRNSINLDGFAISISCSQARPVLCIAK